MGTASAQTVERYIQLTIGESRGKINGHSVTMSAPAQVINGSTLVPLRFIGEAFGCDVHWDPNLAKVTVTSIDGVIETSIGKNYAFINGNRISVNVPPQLIKGSTMVPLRFISESLGATVNYDAKTRSIDLSMKVDGSKEPNIGNQKPKTVKLSDEEHRKINIFFSNFSEAYFPNYDSKKDGFGSLVDFAYIHNKINNPKYIGIEGSEMYIDKGHVEKTIDKFFGRKITHQSIGDYNYRSGRYYTWAADGESYDLFSQVDRLQDNKDGTYFAEISIYLADEIEKTYYQPKKVWENTHSYNYIGRAEATIKPATVDGKATYQLLTYKEFD